MSETSHSIPVRKHLHESLPHSAENVKLLQVCTWLFKIATYLYAYTPWIYAAGAPISFMTSAWNFVRFSGSEKSLASQALSTPSSSAVERMMTESYSIVVPSAVVNKNVSCTVVKHRDLRLSNGLEGGTNVGDNFPWSFNHFVVNDLRVYRCQLGVWNRFEGVEYAHQL
jgi:hypothetical protein